MEEGSNEIGVSEKQSNRAALSVSEESREGGIPLGFACARATAPPPRAGRLMSPLSRSRVSGDLVDLMYKYSSVCRSQNTVRPV